MKQYHPYDHCSPKTQQEPTAVILRDSEINHSKSPTCKPSSCRLSKMWEWNGNFSSISYCWQPFCSIISHLLSLRSLSSVHLMPAPVYKLLYCTTAHFKGCAVRLKMFSLFFVFFYVLFAWKYFKPITVQYYTANCVSWVPGLTLLDLQTNWTYQHALEAEFVNI